MMALHDGHCRQPSLGALGDPMKRHSPIQERHFLSNERKGTFPIAGVPPPRRIVYGSPEQTRRPNTGDQNSAKNELQNAQHHNHIYNKTFSNAHI